MSASAHLVMLVHEDDAHLVMNSENRVDFSLLRPLPEGQVEIPEPPVVGFIEFLGRREEVRAPRQTVESLTWGSYGNAVTGYVLPYEDEEGYLCVYFDTPGDLPSADLFAKLVDQATHTVTLEATLPDRHDLPPVTLVNGRWVTTEEPRLIEKVFIYEDADGDEVGEGTEEGYEEAIKAGRPAEIQWW